MKTNIKKTIFGISLIIIPTWILCWITSNSFFEFFWKIFIFMFTPFVIRLANIQKFSYENGKKLCLLNSIIVLFGESLIEALISGGALKDIAFNVGRYLLFAILFYFVNKILYVNDKDNPLINIATQEKNVEFIDDKKYNIDDKYNDLKKLKELFDDKIITKKEFEAEKKKILEFK